jgi:hypothetical protein
VKLCNHGARLAPYLPTTEGHSLATNGTLPYSLLASMACIADAWPVLPPHIREAILTLVDAGAHSHCNATSPFGGPVKGLAWRIARQCRGIVQGCLRADEWGDADREFFAVLSEGLAAQVEK